MENNHIEFDSLDLDFLKERFNLREVKLLGTTLFVTTHFLDEWFIDGHKEKLKIYHKNSKGSKKEYHKEKKKFFSIFHVLKYIGQHDNKIFRKMNLGLKNRCFIR